MIYMGGGYFATKVIHTGRGEISWSASNLLDTQIMEALTEALATANPVQILNSLQNLSTSKTSNR